MTGFAMAATDVSNSIAVDATKISQWVCFVTILITGMKRKPNHSGRCAADSTIPQQMIESTPSHRIIVERF